MCSVLQKSCVGAVCLLPGIGAALVSGSPAVREQCVVSSGHSLAAEPCLDAIVAGDGRDVFTFTKEGSLQTASGYCVHLAGDKLGFEKCDSNTGVWEVSADGQVGWLSSVWLGLGKDNYSLSMVLI